MFWGGFWPHFHDMSNFQVILFERSVIFTRTLVFQSRVRLRIQVSHDQTGEPWLGVTRVMSNCDVIISWEQVYFNFFILEMGNYKHVSSTTGDPQMLAVWHLQIHRFVSKKKTKKCFCGEGEADNSSFSWKLLANWMLNMFWRIHTFFSPKHFNEGQLFSLFAGQHIFCPYLKCFFCCCAKSV